jgi:hypothetical protein
LETQEIRDMQISVNAAVRCTDGDCGHSTYVLVNPVTEKVTHVVVKGSRSAYMEYLVSVGAVQEATTEFIQLRCTRAELEQMDPFVQSENIEPKLPAMFRSAYTAGAYLYWPYFVNPDTALNLDSPPSGG